eukprot:CAMPEP_0174839208 /NCGR_PEP_ID=MMETSP1114-20130205/7892_1 /TAXON_ID=312471 /ORGANISM="Neobodo designis, Strain CCAP 1951/1" /LENGTH=452 /DNA_ID=CAMNT_0016073329 /DNA_START=41 /DNA_END=1395 /DNA_ORIENTATION=+
MALNEGTRLTMESSTILAALVGQFDPVQGPQHHLRMVKPGSRCDSEEGLKWLMRYLLGDSTLTEDTGMMRLQSSLRIAKVALVLPPTSWNWKHISLPDLGYAVIAVLFTDPVTEGNIVVALVTDHERHGERMTTCAPVLASMMLTAMLNKRREEAQHPDDGLIDAFELALIAQARTMKDLVYAADHIVAGGVCVGVPRRLAPNPKACAFVQKSVLERFAEFKDTYTKLVFLLLSSSSIVIMGSEAAAVQEWVHTAALLMPGYRRPLGTLHVRAAMPCPTLSLQGVTVSHSAEDDVRPNSAQRVLAAIRGWEANALVINTDYLTVEHGGDLSLDATGQPDYTVVDKAVSDARSMFHQIVATLERFSTPARSSSGEAPRPPARQEFEAWLVAMRGELDLLAQRFVVMRDSEGTAEDAFPALTPADGLIICAALPSAEDKRDAHHSVIGLSFNRG